MQYTQSLSKDYQSGGPSSVACEDQFIAQTVEEEVTDLDSASVQGSESHSPDEVPSEMVKVPGISGLVRRPSTQDTIHSGQIIEKLKQQFTNTPCQSSCILHL